MPSSCVQLPALANDAGAEALLDDAVVDAATVADAAAVLDDVAAAAGVELLELFELWLVPPHAANRPDETATAAMILSFIVDSPLLLTNLE
jgi:hypothetical protein